MMVGTTIACGMSPDDGTVPGLMVNETFQRQNFWEHDRGRGEYPENLLLKLSPAATA